MRKIVASLLLAFTLIAQADTANRYSILDWDDIAESVERCLHWKMPHDDGEENLLLGPEDRFYLSPTQADIEEMVAFALANKERTPYVEEAWDCDDFAREAKYWMGVWALRNYQNSRSAVAVGVAYVRVSDPLGFVLFYHAMNVIRRNDGQWFFYEPQNGKLEPVEGSLEDGTLFVLKINL